MQKGTEEAKFLVRGIIKETTFLKHGDIFKRKKLVKTYRRKFAIT